jgi:hypothetical protein
MAITVVSLGSVGNTANTNLYGVAPSRAPNANELVLVVVAVTDTAGTVVQPSQVSGAGLVFSIIGSSVTCLPTTASSQLGNLSIWRSMGAAPGSSRITALFPNNATGCNLLVVGVSGVSTSGTSGANAVSGSSTSAADTGEDLTVWTPSAVSTANGWFATAIGNVLNVHVAQNGWTQLDGSAASYTTPSQTVGSSAYTTVSSANSVVMHFTANIQHGGMVVELVGDNPAIVGDVGPGNYYQYYSHVIVGEAA